MSPVAASVREPSASDKDLLSRISRRLYDEFPEMRRALMEPLRRNAFQNILLGFVKEGTDHTLSQCIVRVARAGYTVTTSTGIELKKPGTTRSVDVRDTPVTITPGSQRFKLLSAYWDADATGLTSDEARRLAKIPEKSCYWKRVSELHEGGYVEVIETSGGGILQRPGDSGSLQRVYRITPFGVETIQSMV